MSERELRSWAIELAAISLTGTDEMVKHLKKLLNVVADRIEEWGTDEDGPLSYDDQPNDVTDKIAKKLREMMR